MKLDSKFPRYLVLGSIDMSSQPWLSFWERSRNPNSVFAKIFQTLHGQFLGAVENIDYGNQYILNEYCGVSTKFRIPGRLQHGWEELNQQRGQYKNNFIDSFVWSNSNLIWPKSQGWKNFHSIGAPWLYLLELLEQRGWQTQTSSNPTTTKTNRHKIDNLWVFGYHSTSKVNWNLDQLKFFLNLVQKKSVQVERNCILLSYSDFQLASRFLQEELEKIKLGGIDVITIGPRRGTVFADSHLFQIYHLLKSVNSLIIDYPSTLVFYSLSIGVPVTWLKNDNYERAIELTKEVKHFELLDFLERDSLDPSEWRLFSLQTLGKDSMRTPYQLKKLFNWNSYYYSIFRRFFSGCRMFLSSVIRVVDVFS